MKIVSIFAAKLFSFHYKNEGDNEFDRLLALWTDVAYVRSFAQSNNIQDINNFVNDIISNAEDIDDFLHNLVGDSESFGKYFEPLQTSEYAKILSFQKGKIRKNRLRLYAIKIDENCFVITGGAIKMSQTMQDHPETDLELKKLNTARTFLQSNGVFDDESFFEIIL